MRKQSKRGLRAREAALARHEVVKRARKMVGDSSFDRDARGRYWSRLWKFSLAGLTLIVITLFGYGYAALFNQIAAVGVGLTGLIASIYVLANSRVCGACGGNISSGLPVYCLECGETYIFHKAGRRQFSQAQERLDAKVRADIEAHRRKHGYEEEIICKVERALLVGDHETVHDELSKLTITPILKHER